MVQDPVRAKIVNYPWDHEWSSARWHVRKMVRRYIQTKGISIVDKKYWKQYLMNSDENVDDEIRKNTAEGKAFAGEKFVTYWENKFGCVLSELKPGPKKEEKGEIGS